MADKYSVVFITSDKSKIVKRITDTLLREKLCACVSCVKGVKSSYHWKGKVMKASETLMIIKTKKTLLSTLIKRVKKLHDYEVPEIISFDIKESNPDYLQWIETETKGGKK